MADPADPTLMVMMGGRTAGVVTQHARRLELVYDETWRNDTVATPLSLSLGSALPARLLDRAATRAAACRRALGAPEAPGS